MFSHHCLCLIHSFNKYFLGASQVPGLVMATEDAVVSKILAHLKLAWQVGESNSKQMDKEIQN